MKLGYTLDGEGNIDGSKTDPAHLLNIVIDVSYSDSDFRQTTFGTIGEGDIYVDGELLSDDLLSQLGLDNRDLDNTQITTKDKSFRTGDLNINARNIVKFKDNVQETVNNVREIGHLAYDYYASIRAARDLVRGELELSPEYQALSDEEKAELADSVETLTQIIAEAYRQTRAATRHMSPEEFGQFLISMGVDVDTILTGGFAPNTPVTTVPFTDLLPPEQAAKLQAIFGTPKTGTLTRLGRATSLIGLIFLLEGDSENNWRDMITLPVNDGLNILVDKKTGYATFMQRLVDLDGNVMWLPVKGVPAFITPNGVVFDAAALAQIAGSAAPDLQLGTAYTITSQEEANLVAQLQAEGKNSNEINMHLDLLRNYNATGDGDTYYDLQDSFELTSSNQNEIPNTAYDILAYIKLKGNPPPGYKGGRAFTNDGRDGGQILPRVDAQGNPLTYKEYDIHPNQPGVKRGAERVVIGQENGKAYYTNDHYRTFIPMVVS